MNIESGTLYSVGVLTLQYGFDLIWKDKEHCVVVNRRGDGREYRMRQHHPTWCLILDDDNPACHKESFSA